VLRVSIVILGARQCRFHSRPSHEAVYQCHTSPRVHIPHSRPHLHADLPPHNHPVMSQPPTTAAAAASSRFQDIFQAAVKSYQKQTKKDLIGHPITSQLQSCKSTSDILAILQDQVQEFDKSRSGDERLTKWLSPTVNVLIAFSATISGGVSLVRLNSCPGISL
jgi:hypothetical protein